jgi:FkbM family methyltransferase
MNLTGFKNLISRSFAYRLNEFLAKRGLIAIPLNQRINISNVIESFVEIGSVKVVYDVGSYDGSWAKSIAKTHFPNAKLYLFEANNRHFPYESGLADGSFNFLLSNDVSPKDYFAIGGTGDSIYRENTQYYHSVEPRKMISETMDNLVSKYNLPLPDFVKIDVQGSELDVLKGMAKILSGVRYLIIETNLQNYNSGAPSASSVIDFLKDEGFIAKAISEVHKVDEAISQIDFLFVNTRL